MTEENQANGSPDEQRSEHTTFTLRYKGQSGFDEQKLSLFSSTEREGAGFQGSVKQPLQLREALATLYEIVKSDYRYVPKDRTAYHAWKAKRGGASASAFEQQRAYFDWLAANDPLAFILLDPIVTAHPDRLLFEVFSKDEGTYARLDVDWSAFELKDTPVYGTTNVDFSNELFDGVLRMRANARTQIAMSEEAFGIATKDQAVVEKKIAVPNTWINGFLQVQSAAALAEHEFELAPMDLYNMLYHLRMNADQKGKGRSIRAELTPGQPPRLVLEPWELVLESGGENYQGRTAEVIRIWGRRRLMMVRRLLPFVERVRVRSIASGMPCFWIFECGPFTLTIGLSGFVASNWSQAVHLDVMLPEYEESKAWKPVFQALSKKHFGSLEELTAASKAEKKDVLAMLQRACRKGLAMYDIAHDVYRYRPLTAEPLDEDIIAFRNERERQGHAIVDGNAGTIKLIKEIDVVGRGIEYHASVDVPQDQRKYETKFQLTSDGRLYRPDCTCTFFRQHEMREGPCPHLYALRLLVAEREKQAWEKRGTAAIKRETRTYVKRHKRGEDVYEITLDNTQVRLTWGLRAEAKKRFQRLVFNGPVDARTAYLNRIASLEAKGFLDATE